MNKKANCTTKQNSFKKAKTTIKVKLKPWNKYLDIQSKRRFSWIKDNYNETKIFL